jgi:hypothetical protein
VQKVLDIVKVADPALFWAIRGRRLPDAMQKKVAGGE